MNPEDQAVLDELAAADPAGQMDEAPEAPQVQAPQEDAPTLNDEELDQWAMSRIAQNPQLAQMAARFVPQPQEQQAAQDPGIDPAWAEYEQPVQELVKAVGAQGKQIEQLTQYIENQARELQSARAAASLVGSNPELQPVIAEITAKIPDFAIAAQQMPFLTDMAKAYAREKANPARVVKEQKEPNQTVDGMPSGKTRSKDEQAMLAAFKASGLMTDKDIADF